jgi:hypothetical protein
MFSPTSEPSYRSCILLLVGENATNPIVSWRFSWRLLFAFFTLHRYRVRAMAASQFNDELGSEVHAHRRTAHIERHQHGTYSEKLRRVTALGRGYTAQPATLVLRLGRAVPKNPSILGLTLRPACAGFAPGRGMPEHIAEGYFKQLWQLLSLRCGG